MPSDPIREQVIDALEAALWAVQEGDEYHHTIRTVWRWRTPQSGEIDYPTAGIFDLDEAVEHHGPPCVDRRLSVMLQGVHAAMSDQSPDTVARRLLADLQKAVAVDFRLGGLVIDLTETANRVAVDAPAEPFVVVELDLEIHYRTSRTDPAARR